MNKIVNGWFLVLVLISLALFSCVSFAQENTAHKNVTVYLFYSKTCPHCAAEKKWIDEFAAKYPGLELREYAVWAGIKENDLLFEETAKKYNTTWDSVPMTFIGDKAFIGFSDYVGELEPAKRGGYLGWRNQIEAAILKELKEAGISEKVEKHLIGRTAFFTIFLPLFIFLIVYSLLRKKWQANGRWLVAFIALLVVCLFIFTKRIHVGQIVSAVRDSPFPIFTVVIALLDSFNPCAMFVLGFLLALLAYSGSRGKIALIGTVFILTSGFMYAFYMFALLGILHTPLFETNKFVLRLIIGVVAVCAGLINIKDFFFFKKGLSLTIPEKYKPGIFARMREIVNKVSTATTWKTVAVALIGTIMLAAFVNIVELACTLMLPLIYTSVLSANFSSFAVQGLYTALYCTVYIIPLLMILFGFLYSLKAQKLSEKQGRILKLLGGLLMLALGLVMIFKPELLMFG